MIRYAILFIAACVCSTNIASAEIITTSVSIGLPDGGVTDGDSRNTLNPVSTFVSGTSTEYNFATATAHASVSSPMSLGVSATAGVRSLMGVVDSSGIATATWFDSILFDTPLNRAVILDVSVVGTLRAQPASDGWLGASSRFQVAFGGATGVASIQLSSSNFQDQQLFIDGWDSYSVVEPHPIGDPFYREFEGVLSGMLNIENGYADWSISATAQAEASSGDLLGLLASANTNFGSTATIVGLRFADTGLTPEQEGISFSFLSGAPSPNAVPEPSSAILMLCSGTLMCLLRRRIGQIAKRV